MQNATGRPSPGHAPPPCRCSIRQESGHFSKGPEHGVCRLKGLSTSQCCRKTGRQSRDANEELQWEEARTTRMDGGGVWLRPPWGLGCFFVEASELEHRW